MPRLANADYDRKDKLEEYVRPGSDRRGYRRARRAGENERAEELRRTALEQLAVRCFGEYFDPFTGQLLGSTDQSWTAAVALDWLAHDPAREETLVS